MVVLERALSSLGRSVNLRDGNLSSSYLCKYAALLASQGALSTAVSYLNNPTEVSVRVAIFLFFTSYLHFDSRKEKGIIFFIF